MKSKRHSVIASIIRICFLIAASACVAHGQNERTRQYWVEFDPTWNLSKRWVLDVEFTPRIAQADPNWWETAVTPNVEYTLRKWIGLEGGLALTYTHQIGSLNSFETRPYAGVKLKLDLWRGIKLNNRFRTEARFQTNLQTGNTQYAGRIRNRLQIMIPINKRSLSENGTLFVLTDAEAFYTRPDGLRERFKDRQRYRIGIGWRKDATWTFQFTYTLQKFRNNINNPFSISDDIFCFRAIPTIR